MKLRTLLYLYAWRLRAHPLQEMLAGTGIAVGVALLFAVQVANTSISGSVEQLITGITGQAQFEVAGSDDQGIDEGVLDVIRAIPGVHAAAPSYERRVVLVRGNREEAIQLLGAQLSLAALGGPITRDFGSQGLALPRKGLLVPEELARSLDVRAGDRVTMYVAGHVHSVRIAATLGRTQIGSLVGSPVAIAPLSFAQRLGAMKGRVSRVFVRVRPGRHEEVAAALEALTGDRMNVGPADSTVARIRSATTANDQSTALFSVISAMVGVLFAFNAMLLTMPERRRFVAELRTQGFTPHQIVATLAFQALALGFAASAIGVIAGDLLSRGVFHTVPAYLAFTFPIGTQRVVPASAVLLALSAGVGASLLATTRPLADLATRRPLDAVYEGFEEPGEAIGATSRRWLSAGALLVLLVASVAVAIAPGLTIVGVIAVASAALLTIPSLFAGFVPLAERTARRFRLNMLVVSLMGIRATMTRSVAVAAIAAVAVFGSVAIGGARGDLVRGLHESYADHLRTADVWVTTAGRSLTTDPFPISASELQRINDAPGVRAVRGYYGGMSEVGLERLWLIARPRDDRPIIPPSQLLEGDLAAASERVQAGGWAAVSSMIARERGLEIGDAFTVPAPAGPLRLRVAAIVTNLSWGPGAIVLNAADYRRAWGATAPTALEIDLEPGVSPAEGRAAVSAAIGSYRHLDVQTAAQLEDEFRSLLREGLTRLNQIATLVVIAAALALAAAMGASMWQRRQRLATYKVQGFRERQLWRVLALDAVFVLALGCLVGAVAGVYGHLLGNRWLALTTGYPAPFSIQIGQAATTLLLVSIAALVVVAIPGYLAARVPPRVSFQE